MKAAATGLSARHTHLIRAAQCAGEVFAHTEESGRMRAGQPYAVWLGLGAFAALVLFVAF
jgi:hypothetical protein